MRSHRITIQLGVSAAVALAVLPATAQANSLLSGYGAPGQGNQAILGSALINGPHRGGGGSGRGGGGVSQAAANGSSSSETRESGASPSDTASSAPSSGASTSSGGGNAGSTVHGGTSTTGTPRGSGHGKAGAGAGSPASGSSRPAPSPASVGFYPAAERVPAGQGGGVLGISGDDLLYAIVAIVVLALIGAATWRLGDAAPQEGTGG